MIENFPKLMTNTKLQTEQEAERIPNRIQKNLHVRMSYQKCQEKNQPMSYEKNGQFYTGKDVQNHQSLGKCKSEPQ